MIRMEMLKRWSLLVDFDFGIPSILEWAIGILSKSLSFQVPQPQQLYAAH